jgi:hypothetical protein
LTATHPPIVERIRRIDRQFDPALLATLSTFESRFAGVDENQEPVAALALLDRPPPLAKASVDAPSPSAIVAQVATPTAQHVAFASDLRASLPPILSAAVHQRDHAIDVVLALILARAGAHRDNALRCIELRLGAARAASSAAMEPIVAALSSSSAMPLALMALPAIKRRPTPELAAIDLCLNELVRLDARVDLFEFALIRLIKQDLSEAQTPDRSGGHRKLHQVESHAVLLLRILAAHGGAGDRPRRAFAAGVAALYPRAGHKFESPPADWIDPLDRALDALDQLIPPAKESLVGALATVAMFDGGLTLEESELLRLTCAALHCPLPPLLVAESAQH